MNTSTSFDQEQSFQVEEFCITWETCTDIGCLELLKVVLEFIGCWLTNSDWRSEKCEDTQHHLCGALKECLFKINFFAYCTLESLGMGSDRFFSDTA